MKLQTLPYQITPPNTSSYFSEPAIADMSSVKEMLRKKVMQGMNAEQMQSPGRMTSIQESLLPMLSSRASNGYSRTSPRPSSLREARGSIFQALRQSLSSRR